MPTDPVRDEAERLVAAALAAIAVAARGLGGAAGMGARRMAGHSRPADPGPSEAPSETHSHAPTGFATGSPECCVCPVCRVIAAMRDPSPDLAERLASGAGELATGVTGLLRAFGRGGARDSWGGVDDAADPWRAATAEPGSEPPSAPPKPMAKKAVKKAAPRPAAEPEAEAEPELEVEAIAPAPAKKAAKTPAKTAPAKKATPAKKTAKKAAPAKAAPAKKAAKKAAPGAGE